MMTFDSLIDRCRDITGSDSETARRIGLTRQHIDQARRRQRINDTAIVALAVLAEVSAPLALASLHLANAKDPAVKDAWTATCKALALTAPPAAPTLSETATGPLYYVKLNGGVDG